MWSSTSKCSVGSVRLSSGQRPFCLPHRAVRSTFNRSRLQIVRAEQQQTNDKQTEKKEKLVENFKKTGLDKATAQRVLDVWKESGASDEEGLKNLLRRRSLASAVTIVIQTALDAGAAYGGFTFSSFLAATDIPLRQLWSFAATFVGSYYAVGVIFDLFTLGVLISSSLQFQTDSAAFMSAVKELAGEQTGLNVIDKAAQARNTLKVLQALNNMADLLKEEGAKDASPGDTLSGLSTYLLLTKAQEQYGFDYEKEGLSYDEASTVARLFAKYDTNSDDRLDLSEITRLAQDLQPELSETDVREAFTVLDSDQSRYIEFPEWVKLYQKKLKKPDEVLTP